MSCDPLTTPVARCLKAELLAAELRHVVGAQLLMHRRTGPGIGRRCSLSAGLRQISSGESREPSHLSDLDKLFSCRESLFVHDGESHWGLGTKGSIESSMAFECEQFCSCFNGQAKRRAFLML